MLNKSSVKIDDFTRNLHVKMILVKTCKMFQLIDELRSTRENMRDLLLPYGGEVS